MGFLGPSYIQDDTDPGGYRIFHGYEHVTGNNRIRPVLEIYSRNVSRDLRREIRNEEILFRIADTG